MEITLLIMGFIVIFAIGFGIYQLLQPKTYELPAIIGTTLPDVIPAVQLEDIEIGNQDNEDAYVIVIDPGHGGIDTGTEGIIHEIEMTHAVSEFLYDYLASDSRFTPVLTHPLDMGEDEFMGQYDRVAVAEALDTDLFLSIHGNSYPDESIRGTECFAIPPGRDYHDESVAFAQLVVAGFAAEDSVLRGDTGVRYGYFAGTELYYAEEWDTSYNDDYTYAVIQDVSYPAVLVEQCYVSSHADMEIFGGEAGYEMAAQVYYQAICDYFYPAEQ